MVAETSDPWTEVLGEILSTRAAEQPIVGTHFRLALDVVASKKGLKFPPAAEPKLRFIQFLERYPNVISILRRPGQDFLVASSEKSDILATGIQRRLYGIRRDLFEAFSIVSTSRRYYDRTTDQVVWQKPEIEPAVSDSFVPIESPVEQAEIQLRRDFSETVPTVSEVLLKSLTDNQPFACFSRKIRETGLQRKWHSFRTERLLKRIQQWAADKGLEWKDAWLTEKPDYFTKRPQGAVPTHNTESLLALFSGLDAADVQRISVPLDLVLKAISSSKKS